MDSPTQEALTTLLDTPRARGAFLLRSILEPPWSMRIEDEAPLCLVTMTRGSAWISIDGEAPARIDPGTIALLRGPDHYTVSDDPATEPDILIGPGQVCTTLHGAGPTDASGQGVRTWGTAPEGSCVMISGTYQMQSEVGRRLLAALPARLLQPVDEAGAALVPLLAAEIVSDSPGQGLILDRLLDLLLVRVLRTWLASPGGGAPSWYRAQHDPVIGSLLRRMHEHPAEPWTVAQLAAAGGISRAALARRFTELVGEPPMNYLIGLRLALAADLLREQDTTVAAVARQVGYSSPFALSTAFKRVRGLSPQDYRRRVKQQVPVGELG